MRYWNLRFVRNKALQVFILQQHYYLHVRPYVRNQWLHVTIHNEAELALLCEHGRPKNVLFSSLSNISHLYLPPPLLLPLLVLTRYQLAMPRVFKI